MAPIFSRRAIELATKREKEVSSYHNMSSTGEEGSRYSCCSWKRLPRGLKWTIIGCGVLVLASSIATLYVFTHHGLHGFHSRDAAATVALIAGPTLGVIGVTGIVLGVMCHELRVKRRQRREEEAARLNLSQNGLNLYNIGNANRI